MSERTEERTKTHARDCISRQKAIDAVNAWLLLKSLNRTMSNAVSLQDVLRQLPSAQSDVARDIATIIENEKDMRVIAQPEIIRCKDCKHYNSYFVECESESGLKHISDHHQWCCNAERREE